MWLEGNMMPGVEGTSGESGPVARDIYIHELTSVSQVKSEMGFFSEVQTPMIAKVKSGKDGNFSIELPAGTYSLFVMEEQGLFANRFDGSNNINPVEVKEGQVTEIMIEIDYKAAY